MRESLSALTLRGRAFVAAGVAAVVCAVLMDQPALGRVGVLVLVLPFVSAYLIGRAKYRLSLVRSVSPQVVPAGQPAQVRLTLTNEGRTPSGMLMLEDQIPYVLGTRPRFLLDGIRHGWRRELDYQVRSDLRGRYQIGPMTVRVSDPFGMVELGHAFHAVTQLTVTPRIVPLAPIALAGAWSGSGDNRPRAFATGSAEDVTVREYRRGDDLRRVHWRSSARVGELMVRREEQPWQSRATVFLDERAVAHRGRGLGSSLETAVHVAASVISHLEGRGYAVRLVTATGGEEAVAWHTRGRAADATELLEALAVVHPSDQPRMATGWLGDHGGGDLVVAVLGHLDERDLAILARMRGRSSAGIAIALDTATWATARSGDSGSVTALGKQGWRTSVLASGERFDRVWERLGAVSSEGAGRVS